jgi:hypothetical protein
MLDPFWSNAIVSRLSGSLASTTCCGLPLSSVAMLVAPEVRT